MIDTSEGIDPVGSGENRAGEKKREKQGLESNNHQRWLSDRKSRNQPVKIRINSSSPPVTSPLGAPGGSAQSRVGFQRRSVPWVRGTPVVMTPSGTPALQPTCVFFFCCFLCSSSPGKRAGGYCRSANRKVHPGPSGAPVQAASETL